MHERRAEPETVAPSAFRYLYFELVRNFAPYAQGMRRFSVTDREIDGFAAEITAAAISRFPLGTDVIQRTLHRGEEIFNRARTLYHWACEAYGRPPNVSIEPVSFAASPQEIPHLAEAVKKERTAKLAAHGTASWDALCIEKIGAFAAMALSATQLDLEEYDPYVFIHKIVCRLSGDAGVFELAALAQLLETETMQLVNHLVAGDTLVELPSPHAAVRTSRIVHIDQEPSAPRGVTEDRVQRV